MNRPLNKPVNQSANKIVSIQFIQSIVQSVCQLVGQSVFQQCCDTYNTVQKSVDRPLWVSISRLNSGFSIPAQIENWEVRTNYRELSWGSSLAGQKTKDSPMTDFSIILHGCNMTRHGYTVELSGVNCICASDPILEPRPIIIKRMFL